ncbi:MAG: vitamin B12 dependent-methionine synthase activation domain-containing protein [Clostridiaceae bacterium]|nr:vitamin B12 dependent-methionine synthase activation domain-containing protein [Clostridiaceae bacterium]
MDIDIKEALRYMGHRGQSIDYNTAKLLDDCIAELKDISKNSFLYEIFDIERRAEGLYLKGTTLVLHGKDIAGHLQRAEKCAIMAMTLGIEVDMRIAYYSKTDLTKGLVLDACATAAAESLCDTVQGKVKAEAKSMGFETTSRYSPGYGDFSIGIQKELTKVLKTYERLGLSVNESSIMIPRKSVTAIIGMQKEGCIKNSFKCSECENKYCLYRKDSDDND